MWDANLGNCGAANMGCRKNHTFYFLYSRASFRCIYNFLVSIAESAFNLIPYRKLDPNDQNQERYEVNNMWHFHTAVPIGRLGTYKSALCEYKPFMTADWHDQPITAWGRICAYTLSARSNQNMIWVVISNYHFYQDFSLMNMIFCVIID